MGKVLVSISDELHRDLKRRAIDENVTLKQLLQRALQQYMERYTPARQA
ncbi:MAG: hypothetical protein ISS52_03810 [Dehalococcoidia bacterium]|nr:hypothetical protein [Dehalococcoidia bacterium]